MYWVTMVFSRSSPKESMEFLDSPVEWQRWWYFNEEDITRVFSNLLGTRHGWHQPQAVHKHRAVRGICPKDVHLSDLFQFSNQLNIVLVTFVCWIPTNGMILRHLTFTCLKLSHVWRRWKKNYISKPSSSDIGVMLQLRHICNWWWIKTFCWFILCTYNMYSIIIRPSYHPFLEGIFWKKPTSDTGVPPWRSHDVMETPIST